MRGHDGSGVMVFDNRYVPFLHRANLLAIANIFRRGQPSFNATAVTAMVDRWRPKTHTFHLPCDEMMITLQDVAMILGLPIRGHPVIGRCDPAGWRGRVAQFLGRDPPPKEDGKKGREAGVRITWLREEFNVCPPHADEATISYYCRAWVWHMFATMLFPDSTGDMASWMYIPCLMDWDEAGSYSWGSAALAFLYRQLCEACRCRAPSSAMGGCI